MEKKCKPLVYKLKRRTGSAAAVITLKLVGKQCWSQAHDYKRQKKVQDGQMHWLWTPERVWCPPWQDNPNPKDPRDQWGPWLMGLGQGRQWRSRHSRDLTNPPSALPIQEPLWVCVTKPCPTLRVILSDFSDSIGWLFSLTRCRAVSKEVLSALFLTERWKFQAWGSRTLDPNPALHWEICSCSACGSSLFSQVWITLGSPQAVFIFLPVSFPHSIPGLQPITPD